MCRGSGQVTSEAAGGHSGSGWESIRAKQCTRLLGLISSLNSSLSEPLNLI